MSIAKKRKVAKRKVLGVGDVVLDRYIIEGIIHTSGMANVYKVSDKNLNKFWCLKEIIKSEAGRNMVEYRSLLNEARILKSLNHSSIPRIVTIEEVGDTIFIVMDYVDGMSVKTWLQTKGVIKQAVVVKWIKQVCGVLIYLHNRKNPIFYRDMKPDNIMIQEDGNTRLLDYGISVEISEKHKVIEEPLGTKGFAAPEQKLVGSPYDLRSDIYALGKTMYYMLTGLNPSVIGDNLRPIRDVDSSLSVGLDVIIRKCLEPNPEDRYQSAEELLYALNNFDKLDTNYRNKAMRKVKITGGLFGLSLFLFITSFIPLGLYSSHINDLYRERVETAYQTGRTEDYLKAIELKPVVLEPYLGLIDTYKVDGVFSKKEESSLLNLVNPNLSSIKKDKQYGEVSYNIGKLYWFYYEGTDGDIVGSRWFKEAIDNEYNSKDAKIYYDLGNFKKNISMAITESSDAGMYKEYLENLKSAKDIDSGEIIELQIYNSIADAVSTYSYRLRTDGVSKEDMLNEIKDIKNYLEVSNPISDKSKELYNQLQSKSETLESKVEATYKGGN